jgi:hypothetical protein
MSKIGYHLKDIPKGKIGEVSKIQEEVLELEDAETQGIRIMQLVELSDIYGSIDLYLKNHFPDISMDDLADMSRVTQRAFINGKR